MGGVGVGEVGVGVWGGNSRARHGSLAAARPRVGAGWVRSLTCMKPSMMGAATAEGSPCCVVSSKLMKRPMPDVHHQRDPGGRGGQAKGVKAPDL